LPGQLPRHGAVRSGAFDMLFVWYQTSEGPGNDSTQTPGPRQCGAPMGALRRPFMPASPGAVQRCARGDGCAKSCGGSSVGAAGSACACAASATAARCIARAAARDCAVGSRCAVPQRVIRAPAAALSITQRDNAVTADVVGHSGGAPKK